MLETRPGVTHTGIINEIKNNGKPDSTDKYSLMSAAVYILLQNENPSKCDEH